MTSSSNPDDLIDLSGRRLGDYQVLRWLGRGGMADVYLAQQQSLQRQVALKILKPSLAEDVQYVRRFQNEAQAAAALVHANIVQIHEVGCVDGLQFIAQEYVRGQNLKELLDRESSLDANRAVAILRQVAAALCKAAEHGIVHRDIKPENILLSTDGTVKVADFGLARRNEAPEATQLTQVGVTMGTPLYMSPEQVEGRALDSRTDIYSLGVTGYQMLAGRPPFNGDTPLSIALQHVKEEPVALSSIREDVPNQLLDLIHRLLAKRPDDRCRDAVEVLNSLDSLPIAGGRSRADTQSLVGSVTESNRGIESRLEVTRTLAAALNTERTLWQRFHGWLPVAIAALVGMAMATPLRRNDPLAGVEAAEAEAVPHKETMESQYFYATLVDNEAAWKYAVDYLPADSPETNEAQRLTVLRAKQQLARWYIKNNRPADALPLLEELAELDDMQNDLRAAGFAWQAIAYQRLGDSDKAADVLTSALSLAKFLDQSILDELDQLETELRAQP